MSEKLRQDGAASSVTLNGKPLTGAQKKALTLLTNLMDSVETLRSLERDAAVDLSSAVSSILHARTRVIETFGL